MAQLSIRLDDALHRRARLAAQASGSSLNAYIARVLSAAVDPSVDEPEIDRIRARLAAAGLIDSPLPPPAPEYSAAERAAFEAAHEASAGGTPASQLVREERDAGW